MINILFISAFLHLSTYIFMCSRTLCQIPLPLLGHLVKEKSRMAAGEDRTRKESEGEVSSDRRDCFFEQK